MTRPNPETLYQHCALAEGLALALIAAPQYWVFIVMAIVADAYTAFAPVPGRKVAEQIEPAEIGHSSYPS